MEPITATFKNGDQLFSAPPPGSGALLGFILKILDGYDFNRYSLDGINNTVLTYHRIIEAFKYAYAKRTEMGDLNFVNITDVSIGVENFSPQRPSCSCCTKISKHFVKI